MEAPDDDLSNWQRLEEWSEVIDDSTYYEILDLLELADEEAIRTSFKTFSLAFHPDLHLDAPEEHQAIARRIFQRGAEAYRILSDPELRSAYDLALAQGRLRLTLAPDSRVPGSSSPPSSPRSSSMPRAKTLEEIARTPAAKLSAAKAEREISQGDFESARRLLMQALLQDDYANPELESRIEALDGAIFAKG